METEKLSDVAPLIPLIVKIQFQKKFGDIEDYSIPYLLNGIERVQITAQQELHDTPTTARPTVRVIL